IQRRAPYVDVVFGPQTYHRLPEMLEPLWERSAWERPVWERPPAANLGRGRAQVSNRVPLVDVTFPEIEKFDRLPEPRAEGPSAFVSVMEGCSKYCTFCVVPY